MILDTCLLIILAIICCLFIDMVENAGDDPGDQKHSFVDSVKVKAPIKVEAFVKVELPLKLRLQASISMCGNCVTTKWTRLISFRPEIHGKIRTNCSVGSVDKQTGLDLQLSLEDLVKVDILCWSWFVNGAASTKYQIEK